MSAFRESLLLQVSGLAEKLEERMFHTYDLHNRLIQEKLQELSEVMERIGHMETELRQVCRTMEAAYKDLCLQPEPAAEPPGVPFSKVSLFPRFRARHAEANSQIEEQKTNRPTN
uniref:Synaptonemal complex central element protein 2 n=1 Tax=Apteryx owenii TaxID=8824 RepID=A0A8B9Q349_APTOW